MVSFKFRQLRLVFLGLICIGELAALTLAFATSHHVTSSANLTAVTAMPATVCLITAWNLIVATLLEKRPHPLYVELSWLIAVTPFNTIFALVATCMNPNSPEWQTMVTVTAVVAWIGAGLLLTYTLILLFLATVTHIGVDTLVWKRDITGSPSPFPIPQLLDALRCRRTSTSTHTQSCSVYDVCMPGCSCSRKLTLTSPLVSASPGHRATNSTHSLISVPSAMDKDRWIAIGLHF